MVKVHSTFIARQRRIIFGRLSLAALVACSECHASKCSIASSFSQSSRVFHQKTKIVSSILQQWAADKSKTLKFDLANRFPTMLKGQSRARAQGKFLQPPDKPEFVPGSPDHDETGENATKRVQRHASVYDAVAGTAFHLHLSLSLSLSASSLPF